MKQPHRPYNPVKNTRERALRLTFRGAPKTHKSQMSECVGHTRVRKTTIVLNVIKMVCAVPKTKNLERPAVDARAGCG